VHTIKTTRDQRARSRFIKDLMGDGSTLQWGRVRGADHVNFGTLDVDVFFHSGRKTWIYNAVGHRGGMYDLTVDGFSGFHEAVAEVGVLVEGVRVSGKGEDVFMVSGGKAVRWHREGWFKDDLGGCAAKIKDSSCCPSFFSSNIAFY